MIDKSWWAYYIISWFLNKPENFDKGWKYYSSPIIFGNLFLVIKFLSCKYAFGKCNEQWAG